MAVSIDRLTFLCPTCSEQDRVCPHAHSEAVLACSVRTRSFRSVVTITSAQIRVRNEGPVRQSHLSF
jgi:hypothetical protein